MVNANDSEIVNKKPIKGIKRRKTIKIRCLSQNYFVQHFEFVRLIGRGGFGKVIHAKEKSTNKSFAIKMISPIVDQNGLKIKNVLQREVNTLAKCSGVFVVNYFDSWIEYNKTLHIQMELCSKDLGQLIKDKRMCFQRKADEDMNAIEFFISGQLLKEITECIQYLHAFKDPIIHRDLKPANILIIEQGRNGRFVKIGDFGLAKPSTSNNTKTHTDDQGTDRYMAPEVRTGNYSPKADIFSLGRIAQDIFEIDDRFKKTIRK